MRALVLEKNGTVNDVRLADDIATPEPQPGEVLVRVRASSLNRVDQVIIKGYPGHSLSFPHILGADMAGEVAALGDGVAGFAEGDRVGVYPVVACGECSLCLADKPWICEHFQFFGMHRAGGFAEYSTVPEANLVRLPSEVDFPSAAAVGVAGLTALHALNENQGLAAGDTLLIWGATGGLGTLALQMAKGRGLRVIATTRNPESHARLTELGADHVLDSNDTEVATQVRELCPSGVDQVIDYVGPATFPTSHQLTKKGGTITLCGILTGLEAPLNLHQTYLRHLRIQGIYLGTRAEYEQVLGMLGDGSLQVPVAARYTLDTATDALAAFATEAHVGKVLVDVA